MNSRRTCFRAVTAACMTIAFAASADAERIKISVNRKTADRRSSEQQGRHGTSVSSSTKEIYYRIDLTRQSSEAPESVLVQWAVLLEAPGGALFPGTLGNKKVILPINREISVQTDSFSLRKHEVSGRHSMGNSIEQNVYGYGVRILSENGQLIEEKYTSSSVKQEMLKRFPHREAGAPPKPLPEREKTPPSLAPAKPGRPSGVNLFED